MVDYFDATATTNGAANGVADGVAQPAVTEEVMDEISVGGSSSMAMIYADVASSKFVDTD